MSGYLTVQVLELRGREGGGGRELESSLLSQLKLMRGSSACKPHLWFISYISSSLSADFLQVPANQ